MRAQNTISKNGMIFAYLDLTVRLVSFDALRKGAFEHLARLLPFRALTFDVSVLRAIDPFDIEKQRVTSESYIHR